MSKTVSHPLSIDDIRRRVRPYLDAYGVVSAAVFGSYARGEAEAGSDLDFLIKFPSEASLFDVINLQHELEQEFQISVDVVSEGGVRPRIRPYIEQEKVEL